MNKTEISYLTKSVERTVLRAEIAAYDNIKQNIYKKLDSIKKVLLSSESLNILTMAYGERFDRLYNKRSQLWKKLDTLYEICAMIVKERAEVKTEYDKANN